MYPQYEYRNAPFYMQIHCGESRCPTRFHKEAEMLWLKKGVLSVSIDDETYTLQPGDVYVVFPNQFHSIDTADAEYLLIIATSELFPAFKEIFNQKKLQEPVLHPDEIHPLVYDLMQKSYEAFHGTPFEYQEAVLTGLVSAALGKALSGRKLIDRKPNSALVEQLMLYVFQHYTEEITLDSLAKELNYNKYYISHIISDAFHCKFRALVNSFKISHAKYLLTSTSKTVSEIAFECGFKNQSSFNRIFLQTCDVTPTDFRKDPKNRTELPKITIR